MGSFNWFKYQEFYFLLVMYSVKYKVVYDIYEVVISNNCFKYLFDNVQEVWIIFWVYLYYLYCIGYFQMEVENGVFFKFCLGCFMNEIFIFLKDKWGMNIVILVVQVLLLVE